MSVNATDYLPNYSSDYCGSESNHRERLWELRVEWNVEVFP